MRSSTRRSGEWWFLHFQDADAYGRVVHLQPVAWRDDWPVIGDDADGDGKGEPRLNWKKPALPAARATAPPTTDTFASRRLGLQWQWQANPQSDWAALPSAGVLRLAAVPTDPNLWSAPNLLLQKFPAPVFTVTTRIDVSELRDGERAGLIVFGGDYAWVGIERAAGTTRMVMRARRDAAERRQRGPPGRGALHGRIRNASVDRHRRSSVPIQHRSHVRRPARTLGRSESRTVCRRAAPKRSDRIGGDSLVRDPVGGDRC